MCFGIPMLSICALWTFYVYFAYPYHGYVTNGKLNWMCWYWIIYKFCSIFWEVVIPLNKATQPSECNLVIFCVIDCQHIFDCWFFYPQTHTHTHIYIYIYSHRQTIIFVVKQHISMTRYARCFKQESKPG